MANNIMLSWNQSTEHPWVLLCLPFLLVPPANTAGLSACSFLVAPHADALKAGSFSLHVWGLYILLCFPYICRCEMSLLRLDIMTARSAVSGALGLGPYTSLSSLSILAVKSCDSGFAIMSARMTSDLGRIPSGPGADDGRVFFSLLCTFFSVKKY